MDVSIQAQVINLLEKLQRERGFSYLFIAHDLEMVYHISHKIGVMYLGNMVELGSSDDVYKKPLHPYTRALISAAPIADPHLAKEKKRIILEGEVPSPLNPPAGCPFAGRCRYASESCRQKKPENYVVEALKEIKIPVLRWPINKHLRSSEDFSRAERCIRYLHVTLL